METPQGQNLQYIYKVTQRRLGEEQIFNPEKQFQGLKPWLERPSDWTDFTANNSIELPAVGVESTVAFFDVPSGQDGVTEFVVANYSASAFDLGDIVYRFYVDDRPVKNLENIQTNLGDSNNLIPLRIRVFSGNRIRLAVFHQANVTLTNKGVLGIIKGYTWSRSLFG